MLHYSATFNCIILQHLTKYIYKMLRIKEIRESKNIKQDEIVKLSGIKKRSYVDYENGKSDIPLSKLQNIATALNVSISELTGESELHNNINLSNEEFTVNEPLVGYKKNASKTKGVPYYDIDFTAGFVEVHNDQKAIPNAYIEHPFFKGCDYVVRASGQSMAKVIAHGDAIGLIEIVSWGDFFPFGEIYAVVTVGGLRMIKVITEGKSEDTFTLISKPTDSKANEFPPQQIKKESILSIFRVQASSHLF